MTTSGLLMWGQAGSYDALADREVVTALADAKVGVSRRPAFSAGVGMDVNLTPWRAVIDCGDGTAAVVATHDPMVVTPAAGPLSGSRTDVVWVDIDPDAATWSVVLIGESATVGRLGIRLGTITVPQGANLANQCTFRMVPMSFQSITHRSALVGGGGGQGVGVWDQGRSIQIFCGSYRPPLDGQSGFNLATDEFDPSFVAGAWAMPWMGQANETVWHIGRWAAHLSTLASLRFQVVNLFTGAAVPNVPAAITVTVYYQARIT